MILQARHQKAEETINYSSMFPDCKAMERPMPQFGNTHRFTTILTWIRRLAMMKSGEQ